MNKTDTKDSFLRWREELLQAMYPRLNPMQRLAVRRTEGPLLVLAGAGSGKTTVLTRRVAHIIQYGDRFDDSAPPFLHTEAEAEEMIKAAGASPTPGLLPEPWCSKLEGRGAYPGSILAITFTNKAAKEMKERIFALLGDTAQAVWVSTFHSACVRILRRDAERIGYTRSFVIYDDTDQLTVIKDCLKVLNFNEKYFPPKEVRAAIGRLKDALKSPQDYAREVHGQFREEQMARLYARYEESLKKNNAMDFDDLLNKTLELFYLAPDVLEYYRSKFRYVLVDEYQDTNFAQYMLIKLISDKHRNLCVVGDDDQSIYRWRGADIRNILEFEKDFPNTRVVKLEENYRSQGNILEAANEVIRNNLGRKEKRLWTQKDAGEPIRLFKAMDERMEAELICMEIKAHIARGGRAGDCAVLYRMNAQSRSLEEAMVQYGIPYSIYGGLRFYDRKEIKDILSYLRLVDNPADDVSLRRIINIPRRGIGDTTVAQLTDAGTQTGESIFSILLEPEAHPILSSRILSKVQEFTALISRLIAMKEILPLAEFVRRLLLETGYQASLEAEKTVEAEGRLENILELISAAQAFEDMNPEGTLTDFLQNIALVSDIDRLEEGQSVLTMMTLHSAKGLEFPIVFLTGLEEGLFPHSRAFESEEELEEERRLCYVGITRAQRQLYLTHTMHRTLYGNTRSNLPSRFLREIPKHLLAADMPRSAGAVKTPLSPAPSPQQSGTPINRFGIGAGRGTAEAAAGSGEAPRFALGEKVYHSKFGNGTVVAAEGEGSNRTVKVAFIQGGIRSFLADLAPLKRI